MSGFTEGSSASPGLPRPRGIWVGMAIGAAVAVALVRSTERFLWTDRRPEGDPRGLPPWPERLEEVVRPAATTTDILEIDTPEPATEPASDPVIDEPDADPVPVTAEPDAVTPPETFHADVDKPSVTLEHTQPSTLIAEPNDLWTVSPFALYLGAGEIDGPPYEPYSDSVDVDNLEVGFEPDPAEADDVSFSVYPEVEGSDEARPPPYPGSGEAGDSLPGPDSDAKEAVDSLYALYPDADELDDALSALYAAAAEIEDPYASEEPAVPRGEATTIAAWAPFEFELLPGQPFGEPKQSVLPIFESHPAVPEVPEPHVARLNTTLDLDPDEITVPSFALQLEVQDFVEPTVAAPRGEEEVVAAGRGPGLDDREVAAPRVTPRRMDPATLIPPLVPAPRPRHPRLRVALATVVTLAVAGSAVAALSARRHPTPPVVPRKPTLAVAGQTLVWSLLDAGVSYQAIVAVPRGHPAVAVSVPPSVQVDLAGSDPIVAGQTGGTGPVLIEVAQSLVPRRVDHYLVTADLPFTEAVDRIGGLNVQLEEGIEWQGRAYGPGPSLLPGGAVLAYLAQSTDADRDPRWQDVLTAVLASRAGKGVWIGSFGVTDDARDAGAILVAAHGAIPFDLPTATGVDGSTQPDVRAIQSLVEGQFGNAGGRIVRVVVLSGEGRSAVAVRLGELLAPEGFEVVASQGVSKLSTEETKVLASEQGLMPDAARLLTLLGVGKVYVDPQPTGIADITVVAGRDLSFG